MPKQLPPYLTREEMRKLLGVIKIDTPKGKRDRAIFYTAYRHGLRATEVGLLVRDDAHLGELRIDIRRVKGSIGGTYLLDPSVVKAIRSHLRARKDDSPVLFPSRRRLPISRNMLHVLMREYGERAGIPEAKRHFHILRHSCGVHTYEATGDIRFVQDWLGHSNIRNTQIYAQVTNAHRDKVARDAFQSHSLVSL